MHVLNLDVLDDQGAAQVGLLVQDGVAPPPSYSDALYRLYLAKDAPITVHIDATPALLAQHHLLTLSPGERAEFGEGAEVLSCAFHHNFFCVRVMRSEVFCDGVVFNRLRGLPIVDLKAKGAEIACARFREMAHVIADDCLFKPEHAVNILRSLLLQAADCKIRFSGRGESFQIAPTRVSDLVSKFQDLVEENYASHMDILEYCDRLGVTIATLNRHVKSELGQTPKQVAQERLALEARVALRAGDRSVKDVAFALGFEDPLYFSRFFRKQFGAAPTQYFTGEV